MREERNRERGREREGGWSRSEDLVVKLSRVLCITKEHDLYTFTCIHIPSRGAVFML